MGDVMVGVHLGHSDHETAEFSVLAGGGQADLLPYSSGGQTLVCLVAPRTSKIMLKGGGVTEIFEFPVLGKEDTPTGIRGIINHLRHYCWGIYLSSQFSYPAFVFQNQFHLNHFTWAYLYLLMNKRERVIYYISEELRQGKRKIKTK